MRERDNYNKDNRKYGQGGYKKDYNYGGSGGYRNHGGGNGGSYGNQRNYDKGGHDGEYQTKNWDNKPKYKKDFNNNYSGNNSNSNYNTNPNQSYTSGKKQFPSSSNYKNFQPKKENPNPYKDYNTFNKENYPQNQKSNQNTTPNPNQTNDSNFTQVGGDELLKPVFTGKIDLSDKKVEIKFVNEDVSFYLSFL